MDKGFEKFMSTAIGQTGIQTSPVNADAVLVDAMTKGIISVGRKKMMVMDCTLPSISYLPR